MSNSVPTVLPALAVVAVMGGALIIGVWMAAGGRSHRPGASAPQRRPKARRPQAPATRRIAPRLTNDAPSVYVATGHDLLRKSQSAPPAAASKAVGRAPVDRRQASTPRRAAALNDSPPL